MGLTRQQKLLRRFVPLVVLAIALVWVLAVALSPGGSTPVRAASGAASTTTTVPPTTSTVPPTTTTTTGPGSLPQSGGFPSATTPQFQGNMQALFTAVASGDGAIADPAFFPEAAYVQLKSIGDPTVDYQDRLLAEYHLDIEAAHAQLGSGASPTLTGVQVPSQYAHWIPSGTCENSVGYFEVANARMVYTVGGVTHSFGIASLISWRGEWYVVHLGAILRPSSGGVVLDPQVGAGGSAPSTTC